MSLESLCDKLVMIERYAEGTEDAWGGILDSWSGVQSAKCRIYPVTGNDAIIHAQPDLRITHRLYFPGSPDIQSRDRIAYDGRYFYVQVIRNIDEQGRLFTVDCEERDG